MIVADTSVWIDFFNGADSPCINVLISSLKVRQVSVTDVIILEVLQGFRNDGDYTPAQKIMNDLVYRPFWGKRNMERTASNYRQLRKKGIKYESQMMWLSEHSVSKMDSSYFTTIRILNLWKNF